MKTVTRALAALVPFSGAKAPTPTTPAPRLTTGDAVALARAYDAGEISALKSRLAAAQAAAASATAAAATAAATAADLQVRLSASQETRKSLFTAWCKEVTLAKANETILADTQTGLTEAEAQVTRLQSANREIGQQLEEARNWALELQAARNAYKAIARNTRARVASNFSLPFVAGEKEAAEWAFEDRKVIDALCNLAEPFEGLEAPVPTKQERNLCEYGNGACRLCRRHKRRGHRQGRVPMSARERYHYLNR